MRAGSQIIHLRADGLHDPRAFMTQHNRKDPASLPLDHMQIGMAYSSGLHPDSHFARLWRGEFQHFDGHRRVGGMEYGGTDRGHKIYPFTPYAALSAQ